MTLGPFRPLHWVLRVSDRKESMKFYCDTLGMKVNRHEDFKEGCEAQCNGPYDGRWSKTMIGYGSENDTFALEITYNYTHKENYKKGNDLGYLIVQTSNEVINKVRQSGMSIEDASDGVIVTDPEGYRFKLVALDNQSAPSAIAGVCINAHDVDLTAKFYKKILGMSGEKNPDGSWTLGYEESKIPFVLKLAPKTEKIEYLEGGGRLAISVPDPKPFEEEVRQNQLGRIHTSFVSLPTPGKTTVSVVILCDPDESEVCVVNDDGFSDLSETDPGGRAALMKDIEDDKSAESAWYTRE